MKRLYYSFNQFLKEKFGCRVHKLSLNAGFSCPNIDGSLSRDGCIFCNNEAFSYFSQNKSLSLEEQIKKSLEYSRKRFKAKKFIAYFQSFTNTYASLEELRERYSIIKKFPDIVGLSISTRPDCIDEEKLDLIESFSRDYMVWIEYGLQSVHNKSLRFLNRNHTFEDLLEALELTKGRNIFIGVHIILGIPYESKEEMLTTAKVISKLAISGIKFHCLYVVKDTKLEDLYRQSKVKVLSYSEYVDIICDFLKIIPQDWVILRLVSSANKKYLIAPLWINNKHALIRDIEKSLEERGFWQGKYSLV